MQMILNKVMEKHYEKLMRGEGGNATLTHWEFRLVSPQVLRVGVQVHVPKFNLRVLVGFQKVFVLKARDETVTVFWYSPEEHFGG